jgi:hypothetical protein
LHNAFDLAGNLTDGSLNTERPHQIDAQFIYRFGWGTTVGVNQYYGSGTPISTQWNYVGVPFFPFGRGNAGTTEDLTQTDLLVTHPFKIGNFTLEASVNVLGCSTKAALLIDNNQFDGAATPPTVTAATTTSSVVVWISRFSSARKTRST